MMVNSTVTRLLGGPPGAVIVKLVILSILVGAVLALLGWTPLGLLHVLRNLVERVFDMGFGAVSELFQYFLYGAVIVVPIWIVRRILGGRS